MTETELKQMMYTSIHQGDSNKVESLIKEHPDIIKLTTPLGTWLHIAASIGNIPVVEFLLLSGLDINTNGGILGGSAINDAASNGQLEMVKFLLSRGAILDTSDPCRNPLFSAINTGHAGVAQFLIKNGIDTTVKYNGEFMKNVDALAYAKERNMVAVMNLLVGSEEVSRDSVRIIEEELSNTDVRMINQAVEAAKGILCVENKQGISHQEQINVFIKEKFTGRKKSKYSDREAIALGAFWGQDIANKLDWEWVKVNNNGQNSLCISDKHRKYAIAPLLLFTEIYRKGYSHIELSPFALYNCIASGNLPPANQGSFCNITSL
jgi:ankyrin repeat protein